MTTIKAPKLAPANICHAPVKPDPVPAYLPAAEIAPMVAFDINIPLPKPIKPQGIAMYKGDNLDRNSKRMKYKNRTRNKKTYRSKND